MKFLILALIILFTTNLYAFDEQSMRRCVLLPITDTAGDSVGFELYEGLERELKKSSWCDYVSSADIIEVFSRYRNNLDSHLQDERVLQTVAKELSAGSIIRVGLEFDVNSAKVTLDVIGENGKDIYLSEKESMKINDVDSIIRKVSGWLEVYSQTIPYDGKVLGALGDEITFSHPKNLKVEIGQKFSVIRLKKKNKHPLLKKIIEWEVFEAARGSVTNVNTGQSLASIKVYSRGDKVVRGDWILLGEKPLDAPFVDPRALEDNSFGKLGILSLHFDTASTGISTKNVSSNRVTGITYGISAEVEAWITRQYFATGKLSRRMGNVKKDTGSLSLNKASYSSSAIKIGGGYKWLPLGFFNGPQVNVKTGYAKYGFDVERSDQDGFSQNSISGFYLAVGGNMPINKGWRVFGEAELIPFSEFEDSDGVFGSAKKSSSMVFNGGAKYQYTRNLTLDGAIEVQSHAAKFKSGAVSNVSYRDTILKFGISFVF